MGVMRVKNLILVTMIAIVAFATSAMAGTVTVSWDANSETDLGGYNIYVGESSTVYTGVVDVGNATSFSWSNLEVGRTYYFAVTAYDLSGNESDFSDEVNATLEDGGDTNPPELVDLVVRGETQLDVVFSEPLDETSAETPGNYKINNNITVLGAILDSSPTVVHLITSPHTAGQNYVLTISNVEDLDGNKIPSGTSRSYQLSGGSGDTTPPELVNASVLDLTHLDVTFSERVKDASAETTTNYQISGGVQVLQANLSSNKQVVQLITTPHQNETSYTLTVNNVRDESDNSIDGNNTKTYTTPSASDNLPPSLVSVGVNGPTQIDINFSEAVEIGSAENKANYAISAGVALLGAIIDGNQTTVHLITSAHEDGKNYTLTVNNVTDRAENPNKIASNSQISYTMKEGNVDGDGDGGDGDQITNPQTFTLFQNYPNPFNPETEIRFFLERQRTIELKVYNPLGQLVKSLVQENMPAGYHNVVWDGTNQDNLQVPSGVYIYSLEVKREEARGNMLVDVSLERRVRKMTLIR